MKPVKTWFWRSYSAKPSVPVIVKVVVSVKSWAGSVGASSGIVTVPLVRLSDDPMNQPVWLTPSKVKVPVGPPVLRKVPVVRLKVEPARQGVPQFEWGACCGASKLVPRALKLLPLKLNEESTKFGYTLRVEDKHGNVRNLDPGGDNQNGFFLAYF